MRSSSFIQICFAAILVSQIQGQPETTERYFGEPVRLKGHALYFTSWKYVRLFGGAFRHGKDLKMIYSTYNLVAGRLCRGSGAHQRGTVGDQAANLHGNRLRLNIDTNAAGYAQVGFLDERGQPIPGYSVQDCVYVNGDAVEYDVEWLEKGKDVSSLAGKSVQLVLELHGAKLYALQFEQASNSNAAKSPATPDTK